MIRIRFEGRLVDAARRRRIGFFERKPLGEHILRRSVSGAAAASCRVITCRAAFLFDDFECQRILTGLGFAQRLSLADRDSIAERGQRELIEGSTPQAAPNAVLAVSC